MKKNIHCNALSWMASKSPYFQTNGKSTLFKDMNAWILKQWAWKGPVWCLENWLSFAHKQNSVVWIFIMAISSLSVRALALKLVAKYSLRCSISSAHAIHQKNPLFTQISMHEYKNNINWLMSLKGSGLFLEHWLNCAH